MGGQNYRRKDLLKLSKNLLFDSGSIEDLKKFSNMPNTAHAGGSQLPIENYELNTTISGGFSNCFNKYKLIDRRRRL
jgi:hypothetical protein